MSTSQLCTGEYIVFIIIVSRDSIDFKRFVYCILARERKRIDKMRHEHMNSLNILTHTHTKAFVNLKHV